MESLSRPLHRRKLSNANAFSFSAKQHPYDDVFTGPTPNFGAPVCAPDYSEIFGASRGSSIPVLDLSGKVSDDCRSSSKLDYPNIFGGFSEEDIAVPYEELFSGAKRGKRSSGKTRAVSEGSDQLSPSGRHKESSSEATNQSFETPKHFNLSYHKTSQRSKDGSNGMTQIAQLHAIPGFTYFIDESSHLPKTESRQQAPFMKTEVHRHKSFSGEIFKGGLDRKGDYLHVPKTQNRSFSGEIFQEGHTVNGNFHAPRKQSSHGHRNRRFSGEIFEEGHSGKRNLHVPKIQSSEKTVHNDRSFSGDLFNGRDRKEEALHVPEKQSSDGVAVKVSSGSSWDAFRFNDKFYCAHDEFDRRSSTTEEASTSKITSPDFKVGASERRGVHATNTSPPSSDEELDANSAAAISAATLKKAIEKAQESIRLAKELMERKRDGVPAPQKQRSKGGSIKSKEHKVECNNGDAVELHRKVGIGLPPFAEVGRRTPSSDGEFASSFKPKEHRWVAEKVKLNFQTENTEASQDDMAATWFSEVVSRRKKDIETLASQQVESDTSNLELGEESNKKLTMNVLEEAEAPEQYMDSSDPAQVHGSEEYVKSEITNEYCFAKEKQNYSSENSENMKKNVEASVDEQWGFKNLQNSQEPLNEEKAGFEEFENDVLRMNRDTPSENETETCADLEEELEVVYEVEEKKSRLRSDEEEPEIVGKETPPWMENEEKPQHEDFQGVQDTGEWKNVVQEREMSESKMTCSREEERNEIKQVGSDMVGLEKISVVPEAPEKIENRADRKKEASQEAEETNRRMEASDTSEDEPETIVARDAGDKQNSDFGEMQGVSKAISGLEECEKDDVIEESPNCKEKEIPGASSDLQNASEEDTSEGKGQDIYEEVSSEDAEEVVSTCMYSGENLPSERVISEEPENTTFTVGDNESHFMPDIHHSEEPESATFTNINVEELFEEETGRDPDASSNLDERDDFWVHGQVENEENFEGVIMATDHIEKDEDIETAQQEKKAVENSDELECSSLPGEEIKAEMHEEESSKLSQQTVVEEEIKESLQHKNNFRKNEVDERQREREKDRLAVERAIREARERAFAEARERAERAAVERATAEVRQRVVAEAREKREKASASNKASTTDKASIEAKLKAERAAVERATSEARERALEKALSQKSTAELTSQGDKHGLKHSFSSSDLEKFDGSNSESAQRRKARLERHQRIMERAAQALAEKNRRDLLAQKEQTERNRLAEALDADIKRWASGKEGNLRALLSTLQYILGPESGWQPISLTEIITTAAVKKAYRRATLYVHPDKLQQRGASIQQKYVCEKVFDLLKAAWNRFNSEER